jgi:membrane protein
LTLTFSLFSVIPSFQDLGLQVEALLFDHFIPESGAEMRRYLAEFTTQARKLSVAGAVILVLTSYLMLSNIEKTFNHIWGTVGGRRGLMGFLQYWAVLTVGPLMVGAGIMMHTYLLSLQLVTNEVDILGLSGSILEYLPWLMTWAGLTLLFVAVPNCRVELRYAIMGGLVTTILFQCAKMLFGLFITNSSYHTVYGAFAIAPVFLLWIHLCWIIVLSGAELVRALETFKSARLGYNYPDLVATLVICWECFSRQERGQTITDRDIVDAGIDEQHWQRLRTLLLTKKILVSTNNNRYVLARDVSALSVWDVINLLGDNFNSKSKGERHTLLSTYDWFPELENRLEGIRESSKVAFGISLKELFDSADQAAKTGNHHEP